MKIGIVGAGALGLAAAWELTSLGHEVDIFERAPFIGGQASTLEIDGIVLEKAYHHLFTSDQAMLDLIDEIGLGHCMRWIESSVGIFIDGQIFRFSSPLDLLKFSPLPFFDRIRLGVVTLYLRHYRNWKKLEQITAAAWIERFAGQHVYSLVWGPLLRGKFGSYHDKVAMSWFWGKIQTRFASRGRGLAKEVLGYPVGSFAKIFEQLAQLLKDRACGIHTEAKVERVLIEDDNAVGLSVRFANAVPSEYRCNAILMTIPSYVLPNVLPNLSPSYLRRIAAIPYLAAVLLVLVLDRPLTNIYWLNIADRSMPFVGIIEHTNLVSPENYHGEHILYISNYLAVDDPLFHFSPEELLEHILPHLKKINLQFDRSWIRHWRYHKEPAAQPVVTTDYTSKMLSHRTPYGHLYLANTTQIYPEDRGTNYSVKMGRQIARQIDKDFEMERSQ